MKTFYTKQLFHKKFPYKVSITRKTSKDAPDYFSGWNAYTCKAWLTQNHIEYAIYTRMDFRNDRVKYSKFKKAKKTGEKLPQIVNITASIFLKTKSDFDRVVLYYKDNVGAVTIPYDTTHVDVLKNDTATVIRKTLLYKKFRYAIAFKSTWRYGKRERDTEVEEWVNRNIVEVKEPTEYKWWGGCRNPRLYLMNDDDLTLLKLSLSDNIKQITVIRTFDELEDQTITP